MIILLKSSPHIFCRKYMKKKYYVRPSRIVWVLLCQFFKWKHEQVSGSRTAASFSSLPGGKFVNFVIDGRDVVVNKTYMYRLPILWSIFPQRHSGVPNGSAQVCICQKFNIYFMTVVVAYTVGPRSRGVDKIDARLSSV